MSGGMEDLAPPLPSLPQTGGGRSAPDMVNHPPHYKTPNASFEVIDVIEAFQLPYHLGCVAKYLFRAGRKDPAKLVEDLKKARWYLDRYISKLEK